MKITQSNFNNQINKISFFDKNPHIAVGVSGGPDSMALVFLLNNWIIKNNGSMLALIVDHNIRKESKSESKRIKNYLKERGIVSKILTVKNANINKKSMNEARDNRFDKLIKYCKKNNFLHLFLGHHLDDNIETFLIRKLSGSNFLGLRSMQIKTIQKGLLILRPLLKNSKSSILEYNKKNCIKYVNDPSNKNTKYTRVIIRNYLTQNLNHKKNVINDFDSIIKYYPLYQKMIYQIFNQIILKIQLKEVTIDYEKFLNYKEEIQSRLIEIIFQYLSLKKVSIRYKKITFLIERLFQNNNIKTNIGGMIVKKNQISINFSI